LWALHPVRGGALLLGAHVVVALCLSVALFHTAIGFGGGLLSPDQIGMLGDGPFHGLLGIWLPVLLHPVAALLALAAAPRHAWPGPVLCVLASVVLAAYFSTTFETPVFVGG
jgi:hypothetical protein